jgi:hypothetical protein
LGRDLFTSSSATVVGNRIWRHWRRASFDKLRMRFFLRGTIEMRFSIFLILSLSKDAPAGLPRVEAA